ncbi:uncharacterized protein LOC121754650 [Salvia splendens]|uniref:uncharacterized protein LOC121754650 n=1 Tax=Salvia splendens TaxID=180675 RepID=UPI001C25E232|nr:uncharacterized protein LOC121754650 [Salvia splendens]
MSVVNSNHGGLFFVYGYGGTRKTFIWKTLSAAIRSKGDIVLNVASSGIASLLLPSGRTTHSQFKIPINPNEDSICNIKQGSALAELIVRTKLMIWDEAPMVHKHCVKVVDRSLRDLMRVCNELSMEMPFGGKLCKVLRLTKNIRVLGIKSGEEASKLKAFSKWIASIGDGVIGGSNDGEVSVDLPTDIVLPDSGDSLQNIVTSIYPSYMNNQDLSCHLHNRAILAPTLDVVDLVNQYMISLDQSNGRVYLSSDSISKFHQSSNGFAEIHSVGTPVMLLRNIDHANGLCNGTRLIITRLGDHVLEAKVLSADNQGHKVLIPRMSLTPFDPRFPFKFQRGQFPLSVPYAMTINKSQGSGEMSWQ